jgi:hypothetical protein
VLSGDGSVCVEIKGQPVSGQSSILLEKWTIQILTNEELVIIIIIVIVLLYNIIVIVPVTLLVRSILIQQFVPSCISHRSTLGSLVIKDIFHSH